MPADAEQDEVPGAPAYESAGAAVARVVLPYIVLAAAWIALSDAALETLVRDPQTITRLSMAKGLAFVVVTSALLAGLVRREVLRRARDRARLEEGRRLLEQSERKYRELVQNANSIILHWDSDGRILFMNDFGLRFFGYTAEELVGRHVVGTIVPPMETSGRDLADLMGQILADPKAFEYNVNENTKRTGERVWIAWTNRILGNGEDAPRRILSIGVDITRQRQAEAEIQRLNDELRRYNEELEQRVLERTRDLELAKQRAEEADRLKSAFLATMSHELRTPLNSIIGFTGILLQELAGPLTDEQRKQLGMVQSSARHLLGLINDLLDISKIEAGQMTVHREEFDVRGLLQRAVESIRPLAEGKGLRLEARIADDLGRMVSDQKRVEQIILNLLNNAVKFTERGMVLLVAETHRTGDGNRALTVRVEDTGIGIAEEDLATLFQPFRQIDTGLSRRYEGTGLGLAISRRLAELLGGSLEAESRLGEGSIFTVSLPMDGQSKDG